ncbi:predicted protein [Histoplasma mississippiense (nom. inval.)]|nr:predicted protein [Histoplasma mississippiense (nom. inval.)]EDN05090.1 predicted protein [Histoplasma mississippiense (nom. inval.)]
MPSFITESNSESDMFTAINSEEHCESDVCNRETSVEDEGKEKEKGKEEKKKEKEKKEMEKKKKEEKEKKGKKSVTVKAKTISCKCQRPAEDEGELGLLIKQLSKAKQKEWEESVKVIDPKDMEIAHLRAENTALKAKVKNIGRLLEAAVDMVKE